LDETKLRRPSEKYRADIDGLRAVAILGVLAWHLNLSQMSGGFVGVDVFFVISGYLISSIIFAEIAESQFSVVRFYERRIRRIFPALFGMLLAVSAFAVYCLLPTDLVAYCKSLLAATFSASNLWFWKQSDYFDSPLSSPLIHTWSLAVEEQFYILFPIFLVITRRFFPRKLRTAVIILFIVSLLSSGVIVHFNRMTAFYMPYTRAWELLMGTLLSLKLFPRLPRVWQRNLVSTIGAVLVLYPMLRYTPTTTFPGFAALVPCLGSALIIGTGESGGSVFGSVLSWRPVVFVGLISYSLYLWHWPIIIVYHFALVFGKGIVLPLWASQLYTGHQYRYDVLLEVLLSFIAAILSWRFVERPFRSGSLRLKGRPLFAVAAVTMGVFAALSLWGLTASGFTGRFSPESLQLASYEDSHESQTAMRSGTCFISFEQRFEDYDRGRCLQQKAGGKNYLLVGDSHSAMLWYALSSSLPTVNVMQANAPGCKPVIHPTGYSECAKLMNFIYYDYLARHKVDELLLEARWFPEDLNGLAETILWAKNHGVPVTLFGPVPEWDTDLPRLEAYSVAWSRPKLASRHRVMKQEILDAKLSVLAANAWQIPYVSVYQAICPGENCDEFVDRDGKIPIAFDTDHLSKAGSLMVVRRLINRRELN